MTWRRKEESDVPKVALYSMTGEQVGEVELKDEVFGIPVHRQAMHDAVA